MSINAKDTIRKIREDQQPPPEEQVPSMSAVPTVSAPPVAVPAAPEIGPEGEWEPWMQRVLDQVKKRFVDERVNGFTSPVTQQTYPPVSREEAEARWLRGPEKRFRDVLMTDEELRAKFGAPPAPAASAETATAEPAVPEPPVEAPPAESPPDESADAGI